MCLFKVGEIIADGDDPQEGEIDVGEGMVSRAHVKLA